MSNISFIVFTLVALAIAAAGIVMAANTDQESATAVTAAVGIAGTLAVATLNLWHARWSQAAREANERARTDAQHEHEMRVMARERILAERSEQVRALRRSFQHTVANLGSAHELIQVRESSGIMRDELISRLERIQSELANDRISETTAEVVLLPVSSKRLRDHANLWFEQEKQILAIIAKYSSPPGVEAPQQSGGYPSFLAEWQAAYPAFEAASLKLARSLEDYASGRDPSSPLTPT